MPHSAFKTNSLRAAVLLAAVSFATAALADTPSQVSEINGATTGLGSSHRFHSTDAALQHCPGDTIVWSAGGAKTYYMSGDAEYGKGSGFYACKAEADDAGFQPRQ